MKILQCISAIILSGFVICVAYAQPPVDFQGMQQRYQQMQALMNRAQTSQNPSERYDLMLQHSQLMQQQMQSMNGMMGGYGPGIPDKDGEKVFAPYFSTKATGFGLGLAYCRLAVEGHGGRIWIENTAKTGSRFVFSLPINNGDDVQ